MVLSLFPLFLKYITCSHCLHHRWNYSQFIRGGHHRLMIWPPHYSSLLTLFWLILIYHTINTFPEMKTKIGKKMTCSVLPHLFSWQSSAKWISIELNCSRHIEVFLFDNIRERCTITIIKWKNLEISYKCIT